MPHLRVVENAPFIAHRVRRCLLDRRRSESRSRDQARSEPIGNTTKHRDLPPNDVEFHQIECPATAQPCAIRLRGLGVLTRSEGEGEGFTSEDSPWKAGGASALAYASG